ncbi:hypothetical protein C8Q79DRAFT_506799 [Trametes meyenii]|nr:hypothetical protein C8Q79DRAFT_506799 [Trametes meyenii]
MGRDIPPPTFLTLWRSPTGRLYSIRRRFHMSVTVPPDASALVSLFTGVFLVHPVAIDHPNVPRQARSTEHQFTRHYVQMLVFTYRPASALPAVLIWHLASERYERNKGPPKPPIQ